MRRISLNRIARFVEPLRQFKSAVGWVLCVEIDSLSFHFGPEVKMVGDGRFELPTSCMSSKRSNQLS